MSAASCNGTPLCWHRHRNGELIEVAMVTEAMALDGIHASMAWVRDMTAQRRAKKAQQDLAIRLTTTFESITDAFYTLDRDWPSGAQGACVSFNWQPSP